MIIGANQKRSATEICAIKMSTGEPANLGQKKDLYSCIGLLMYNVRILNQ